MSKCACGCGADLPPSKKYGHRRKWATERCRKSQYAGTCEECGGATDPSNGAGQAPRICRQCFVLTPEKILSRIVEMESVVGRTPTMAESGIGNKSLQRTFGSWNKALIAAGFDINQDKSKETYEEMRDAVLAGESVKSIANRYGVSTVAVYQRLQTHGTPVSELVSRV